MSQEPKPCPFCGEDAHINKHNDLQYDGAYEVGYSIGCDTWACIAERVGYPLFGAKESAIEAWNRRA